MVTSLSVHKPLAKSGARLADRIAFYGNPAFFHCGTNRSW